MNPKTKKITSVQPMVNSEFLSLPKTLSPADLVRIQESLAHFAPNMDIVEGTKLATVLEVIYKQGKKDGLRAAIEILE